MSATSHHEVAVAIAGEIERRRQTGESQRVEAAERV
jgi:hypothetical protein